MVPPLCRHALRSAVIASSPGTGSCLGRVAETGSLNKFSKISPTFNLSAKLVEAFLPKEPGHLDPRYFNRHFATKLKHYPSGSGLANFFSREGVFAHNVLAKGLNGFLELGDGLVYELNYLRHGGLTAYGSKLWDSYRQAAKGLGDYAAAELTDCTGSKAWAAFVDPANWENACVFVVGFLFSLKVDRLLIKRPLSPQTPGPVDSFMFFQKGEPFLVSSIRALRSLKPPKVFLLFKEKVTDSANMLADYQKKLKHYQARLKAVTDRKVASSEGLSDFAYLGLEDSLLEIEDLLKRWEKDLAKAKNQISFAQNKLDGLNIKLARFQGDPQELRGLLASRDRWLATMEALAETRDMEIFRGPKHIPGLEKYPGFVDKNFAELEEVFDSLPSP